ncbi:MAG: tRNA pseudouridine(38-40) synthase TruA [Deltaproteobacteria bacterium]|nr:tRNA pseudouridine(38-40) synthase TruA [Deltaproteobacteria bacterium]MBW2658290.1 tRNA pseudouridine(38-40) synthase TruA [Deltaproteobacteria bacterium]
MFQLYRNIRLDIAYDGTGYSGWQRQKEKRTIQGEIETRLNRITGDKISLHGAGRTDAGVHAEGMVAHFRTTCSVSTENFSRALNSMLPASIRIFSAKAVSEDFHARFSALGKQYRYAIFTGEIQPPTQRLYSLHIKASLNFNVMEDCLVQLEGTHDFSSFENSGSRDKRNTGGRGAVRTISRASLRRESNNRVLINFSGDGFLRSMVRNMVGTLLDAGRGRLTPHGFGEIMQAGDRTLAGQTAPPHGLNLVKVVY